MKAAKQVTPAQALNSLASLCAKAEHCEDDVRRKLALWKIPEAEGNEIIRCLREENYIDDARYCNAFVLDKWKFNRWGKNKIRMQLRVKHLPDAEIEAAINTIDEGEYLSELKALLMRKARQISYEGEYEKNAKLSRFAAGRGFEPEAISKILEGDGI